MSLNANALTTVANLKEVVGIASADTSKDSALERIINRTTLFLEGELNRKLKARRYNGNTATPPANIHATTNVTDEDYLYFSGSRKDRGGDAVIDPRGYGLYYLPAWPVRSNAETGSIPFVLSPLLTRDSNGETWDDTALQEYRDYLVNRETGELRLLAGSFTPGVRNYRVTMCAGYLNGSAQPYVPDDLEGLCLEIARDVYRNSRDVTSESIGTWSRSYDKSKADPYVEGLISKYSRVIL